MDANANAADTLPQYIGIVGLLHNRALIAGFVAFFIAQVAKVFTHFYADGKWDLSRLLGSGGMPSSHTSAITAVTSCIGILQGTNSSLFALGLIFSLIVMYDASGVRLHAGRQASVLNMIIIELPPDHPVSDSRPLLKDTLGHTPLQVAIGAVVGMTVGSILGLAYA